MKRAFLRVIAVSALAALVSACGGGGEDRDDIAKIASDTASLSSLVAAASKAGLVDELARDDSSLTVFAPTNEAFDALAQTLGFADGPALVGALDADTLAQILSYHVLPAARSAADLSAGGATQATLYTFEGAPATLGVSASNGVSITDAVLTQARVTGADVRAENGFVHVIDKVLVPPGVLNIVQMAQLNPAFTSLVGAVLQADLATTLSGPGPFTVFAPVNDAFAAIASTVENLSDQDLATVLTYHVLGDEVLSTELGPVFGTPVNTVAGQTITINNNATAPAIATITDTTATPANIVAVDVRASNGVIHVIDKVLIPSLGE